MTELWRLNGTTPVNALVNDKTVGQKSAWGSFTSTITIAKAKISPSLLVPPFPPKSSGAVHRAVWPGDVTVSNEIS